MNMTKQWMAAGIVAIACLIGGCASQDKGSVLRSGIPPKANVAAEGSGQLTYTAEERGRLYLYNASDDRVVGDYHVRPGQRFAVNAAEGRATLDGNEVSVGKLDKGDRYQIYMLLDD